VEKYLKIGKILAKIIGFAGRLGDRVLDATLKTGKWAAHCCGKIREECRLFGDLLYSTMGHAHKQSAHLKKKETKQ